MEARAGGAASAPTNSPSAQRIGANVGPHGSHPAAARVGTNTVVPPVAEAADSNPLDTRIAQLMRVMSAQILRRESSAQLRLNSDELGPINVNLRWHDSSVTVRIETQSEAAHDLLARDQDALREGLQHAGFVVERIEVQRTENAAQQGGQAATSDQPHRRASHAHRDRDGSDERAATRREETPASGSWLAPVSGPQVLRDAQLDLFA